MFGQYQTLLTQKGRDNYSHVSQVVAIWRSKPLVASQNDIKQSGNSKSKSTDSPQINVSTSNKSKTLKTLMASDVDGIATWM